MNFFFKILFYQNNSYICRTKFEAIHNKDYSVVKTFKAGADIYYLFSFLF